MLLSSMRHTLNAGFSHIAPREGVLELLERSDIPNLPVVTFSGRWVSVIRQLALVSAVHQESRLDILTIVGASKNEGALSSARICRGPGVHYPAQGRPGPGLTPVHHTDHGNRHRRLVLHSGYHDPAFGHTGRDMVPIVGTRSPNARNNASNCLRHTPIPFLSSPVHYANCLRWPCVH